MAPMLTPDQVAVKVEQLRARNGARDARMMDVHAVRRGDLTSVYPDLWPEAWPRPIVANFIDTAARDLAEVIAPLPAFNCSSASMVTDKARSFADKRTKVAHYYVMLSELQRQMFDGVDSYLTYGFLPFFIEPDYDNKSPRVRIESPMGGYPEFNRWHDLVSYTKVFRKSVLELRSLYPEYTTLIRGPGSNFNQANADTAIIELIRYQDKDRTILYLPQRKNFVLEDNVNKTGKLMVEVAVRPNGRDNEQSGQFDDVVWVQLARSYMALLGLEATEKSVQAPLAVPSDVQEFPFGPDAIIRTQNPQAIRRVGLELPPGAFEEQSLLDDEQRVGSRYPDARTGNVQSSVITGTGVQALMGGFDTQIKTAQDVLSDCLRKIIGKCFLLDEVTWPNLRRTIRGEHDGAPFEITYTPSKDIAGDYTIDVSYGFMSGLQPNQALVFMLQLRGDHLISRDLVQRQMPFGVNVSEEQRKIDVEETRDALKQAVFGMAQAMPEMAAQGGDPSNLIRQMTVLIQDISKGKSIEDAAALAFAPPPPPPPAPDDGTGQPDDGSQGQGIPGIGPDGRVTGVAPGQAGQGQGGRPQLQTLLAGLSSSGAPALSAGVTQRIPVGI